MLTTLFLDLNAYFASVEQQMRPALRDRPIAVAPVEAESTCCIAASYEAKRFGITTGMQVAEARRRCPGLLVVQARPELYVRIHHQIVAAVDTVLPVGTVYSIDEMACRLMGRERIRPEAVERALRVKRAIRERVGDQLSCSIGIAPNRFLAKVASNMQKPDGLIVIERSDLPQALHSLELEDLPGIARNLGERLRRKRVHTVAELCSLSEPAMRRLFESVLGTQWYQWLRGDDVEDRPTQRRSIGHEHVLPPELRTRDGARSVMVRLLHKAMTRTRRLAYWPGDLTIHVRYLDGHRWRDSQRISPTIDTLTVLAVFNRLWTRAPAGRPLKVGIVLGRLTPTHSETTPLFPEDRERNRLGAVLDAVNARFGKNAVYPASMHLARAAAPMRISFSSIPDPADG